MNKLPLAVLLVLLLMLLFGCTGEKKNSAADVSLVQMAQATQLVVAAFDGQENPCGISPQDGMGLVQLMRAQIDERYKTESVSYLKYSEEQKLAALPTDCTQDCSCSFFLGLIEKIERDGYKLSPAEQERYQQISADSKKPLVHRGRCVDQAAKWFCKSDLLKQMITEVKHDVK